MTRIQHHQEGKPYIVYLCAGPTDPADARHQGYTVVLQTKFRTLEDMKYFDEQCPAHQALKGVVKALKPAGPPLVVYFEGTPLVDETRA